MIDMFFVRNKFSSIDRNLISQLFEKYGIFIFLILILVCSGIFSPAFLRADNVSNMLLQFAPLGIVVIGQAFVILSGGLDLSVASLMATTAVVTTGFTDQSTSVTAIIILALAVGFATGLTNGILVSKRNVSPFLATLATMIVLQGLRFAYTQGAPSGNVPKFFRIAGSNMIGGIPYNLIIMIILAIIFGVVLHKTTFGRKVYITGGNPEVARMVGINKDLIIIGCYIISSVLSAIAGLILSGYVGIVDNWVGKGFELDSIVACVMGGIALSGGRGSIIGGLVGAAILIIIFNIVLLIGLPIEMQIIIKGIIIIIAAGFYIERIN